MEYSTKLPANFMKRSMMIVACLFLLKKDWDKCAYLSLLYAMLVFFFAYFKDFLLSETELSYKTSYKYATCF